MDKYKTWTIQQWEEKLQTLEAEKATLTAENEALSGSLAFYRKAHKESHLKLITANDIIDALELALEEESDD